MARKSARRFNPFDQHVALRAAAKRKELGLSQAEVANVLGVAFQQVQKYEKGRDRISAGRLWQFAKCFDVPVGYFFLGLK